jgi:hypothetical protein
MRLRGRGNRRRRRTAHRAAEFRARFASNGGGIGGQAASPVGAACAPIVRPARIRAKVRVVHLRPIQRAVAGCRDDRIMPPEIAPLAGLRAAAESLLH